jgi:menaquinone-dependent protoporphyrinogen oxidase
MTVLVAYATAHGSTRDIAERIATRLRDEMIDVRCLPVTDVENPSHYQAVVLGSAIHDQAWLPEARRFVHRNGERLADLPLWLFSVGMPGALPRWMRTWAMKEGPRVVAEFGGVVRPRGSRLFSGVATRQQFPLLSRLIMKAMGARFGDYRDWSDIDAWAGAIADELATSRSLPR